MSKIDYADMPASVEKHSPAPQPTTLENPAVADGQKPEAGSSRDKSTQAVFTNNDAPCNGVAPSGEETSAVDELAGGGSSDPSRPAVDNPISKVGSCLSDAPMRRCTDNPMINAESQLEQIMDFLQCYLVCRVQAALHHGYTLHGHHLAVLLDDREATLGSLHRSKNPPLRAVLAGGFQKGIGYSDQFHERAIYSAKAFAGMSKLPEALADRSIPIDLGPKQPGGSTYRFRRSQAQAMAAPLLEWLQRLSPWAIERLQDAPAYCYEDFPEGLSFRQQDCVEALLQIADLFGGPWPEKARQALATLFRERVKLDQEEGLQLLADIHDILSQGSFPERISTGDLLPSLQNLKGRPWNLEGPITAQKLAYLLQSFGVTPRLQRISPTRTARGYRLEDFQNAWKQFLNIEIVNNHAACNGVAPSDKQSTDGEIVRCSDHETGVDLAFASSQQLAASSCSSTDDELLQYIQQKHGPSFDRQWLADTRARGYEPLHPGDPGSAHTYHGSVPVRGSR